MRRISITKLFSLLPKSNRTTTFALSRADPTPFTKLKALYVRLESIQHISLELVHGKSSMELMTIDIRAGDMEFGYEDVLEIKSLVDAIQKEWRLPVIARPVVLAFLSHLYQLGPNNTAKRKDLNQLIESHPRDNAASWFNH